MTTLSQVVAARTHKQKSLENDMITLAKTLRKGELFHGAKRTYTKLHDEGVDHPGDEKLVQYTVADVFEQAKELVQDHIDLNATNEFGNAKATADLVLGGQVMVKEAPVTFLMSLEKSLKHLRDLLAATPELPSDERWGFNDQTGFYETEPKGTVRSAKVPEVIVKYEATENHPAQTELITLDKPEGTWFTTKFSGAIPPRVKAKVLKRVDEAIVATKKAREMANTVHVDNVEVGAQIFDWIVEGAA